MIQDAALTAQLFKQIGSEWLSKEQCCRLFTDVLSDWPSSDVQALVEAVPLGEDGFIDSQKLVDFIYLPRRKEFQGGVINDCSEQEACESMVLITDPGDDNDDEMAILLLSELVRRGEVKVEAVIANLRPANRRAALVRGTLDTLGMVHVPVGIGSDGGSTAYMQDTDTFSESISESLTGLDYFSGPWEHVQRLEQALGTEEEATLSEQFQIYDGQKLLVRTLSKSEDKSLNLVLISSHKDAAMLLQGHEDLFLRKIKCVTIMGGVEFQELPNPKSETDTSSMGAQGNGSSALVNVPMFVPSDALNNTYDSEASSLFLRRCQELGVPLVVLSRFAAYGCPVQKFVYDLMVRCPIPHPTVCRLHRTQRSSIERLWQNVCAGGKLPERCDRQWFFETFCHVEGMESSTDGKVWDMVKTFSMYAPLAIVASMTSKRQLFFCPTEHVGPHGTIHLNIGASQADCGILSSELDNLHDFMVTHWLRAAGRPFTQRGDDTPVIQTERPALLHQDKLTAALGPMKQRGHSELDSLNLNVIRLLDVEWPKLKNSSLLSTWRDRDEKMRNIGPEMVLVDPDTIQVLGRIPHSAEGKTITMEEAASRASECNMRFFIEMFSHRWHTPYAPDDRYCNKARVLCEWAAYRKSMNFRTFFWIDHACINQNDIAPGVTMLPLYVSCCNNILCYDVPEYEPRAWCRVERLLFAAFVAPNNEYVTPNFVHQSSAERLASGELKPTHDLKKKAPDPAAEDAELSFPSDSKLIGRLKELCTEHWAKCWKDGLMDIVENKVGLSEVRNLRYGSTQVRMRHFL